MKKLPAKKKKPVDEVSALNAKILRRVKAMTPQERFQSLVDAGVFTPDGKLAPAYR